MGTRQMDTDLSELDRHGVDLIAQRASAAFDVAARLAPAAHASWLEAIADRLEPEADELIELAGSESHLPEGRLRGELVRTIFQLRLLAAEARSGLPLGATIDHEDPSWPMGARPDLRRINQPLGVVAVFGASNFPFAFSVLGGDSASALAAGCAVIHKAHPAHPRLARRTAELAVQALEAAGAPEGIFALVEGQEAGEALVTHPAVKAVGFTGSTVVGRHLFDLAAQRPEPIPFFGELGSTNPVFVTQAAWAARSDEILSGYLASVGLGMGQFCTKPGYLVIPESDRERLARILRPALEALGRHPLLTPRLRDGFDASVSAFGRLPDVTELVAEPGDADLPGVSIFVTTGATVLAEPGILEHELFGPASVIVTVTDDAEALKVARLVDGQLTTGIQGQPDDDVAELVAVLRSRSGRVLWNGWPTGVTVSYAQQHGGPYPATTASATTSVGTAAISRFLRPVAFQDFPANLLPQALRDDNPWQISQRVDGVLHAGAQAAAGVAAAVQS